MPLIVGVDEVGYGPKLGPLVVCAAAFRVPEPDIDLWRVLDKVVTPDPRGRSRIPVCDSKKIFSQPRGLPSLEPTVHPFLVLANLSSQMSYPELVRALSGESTESEFPWYHVPDASVSSKHDPHLLRSEMDRAGVQLHGFFAQVVEPRQFNALVNRFGNKSHVLFHLLRTLAQTVLSGTPETPVAFHVGKHGGRQFYLADLIDTFPGAGVMTVGEERDRSSYEITHGRKKISMTFHVDGEDKQFTIALASMIGKYIRERGMSLFNRYWQSLVPGIRPTAGYHPDADRFLAQIAPAMSSEKIGQDHLVRIR